MLESRAWNIVFFRTRKPCRRPPLHHSQQEALPGRQASPRSREVRRRGRAQGGRRDVRVHLKRSLVGPQRASPILSAKESRPPTQQRSGLARLPVVQLEPTRLPWSCMGGLCMKGTDPSKDRPAPAKIKNDRKRSRMRSLRDRSAPFACRDRAKRLVAKSACPVSRSATAHSTVFSVICGLAGCFRKTSRHHGGGSARTMARAVDGGCIWD